MGKMMVMQSLAWAAAIIVVALLGGPPMAPILLAVLGTLALGRLRLDAKLRFKIAHGLALSFGEIRTFTALRTRSAALRRGSPTPGFRCSCGGYFSERCSLPASSPPGS